MRAVLSRAALALLLASAASFSVARAATNQSPVGTWLTQDRDGVIQIYRCGAGICGRIVGMSEIVRPDGTRPVDRAGHPQCGLVILRETADTHAHIWSGRITNPDDGSTWRCESWVDADGLHLRGYIFVPMLGQTQVWRPYTGALHPDCRMG